MARDGSIRIKQILNIEHTKLHSDPKKGNGKAQRGRVVGNKLDQPGEKNVIKASAIIKSLK